MNFFQHQDAAKKKTTQLVILMGLAVAVLIAVTTLCIAIFLFYLQGTSNSISATETFSTGFGQHFVRILSSDIMLWISLGVIGVVSGGSLYKVFQLRGGGAYIAESLGGKEVLLDNATREERRLLNVVEEIAIASGTLMPKVYVLDENGINAFAAGTDPNNTVVGVTRGCINTLNRSELQGVIAHEFSHIHHGDMRLNMRLLAILHGILLIGLIGQLILRSGSYSSRKKGGGQQVALGLGLMAIGYGGTFFGNIIKSAVSRQREFLADASSVQYTRNPEGIAGALYKIGQSSAGSTLETAKASEFSHFYFSNGVRSFLSGMFATHPPLDTRIHRVMPKGYTPRAESSAPDAPESKSNTSKTANPLGAITDPMGPGIVGAAVLGEAINAIGNIHNNNIQAAESLIDNLPKKVYEACHNAYQARAIVYAVLIDQDAKIEAIQVEQLRTRAHPQTFKFFNEIYGEIKVLDQRNYLPLVQLCCASLRDMSKAQAQVFLDNLKSLSKADNQTSVFEWCVLKLMFSLFGKQSNKGKSNNSLDELKPEIIKVLSYIAQLNSEDAAADAFGAGYQLIWSDESNSTKLYAESLNLNDLDNAVNAIQSLKVLHKPTLLKAVARVIEFDNKIEQEEFDVFRAVGAILDCPVPLLNI